MSRIRAGARLMLVAGLFFGSGSMLTACGSGGSSSASADTTGSVNRSGASIQGVPQTTAVVGQPYSFTPSVSGTTGSVTFTVANLPAWAKFNAANGQISGTPNQAGSYEGIIITMADGGTKDSLDPFTINVASSASADSVTLSWQPPTTNADGTPLLDLQGYDVHYGTKSQNYTETVKIANPGVAMYVVQNLTKGTYYFAVTAYNSKGVESALSPEVSLTL